MYVCACICLLASRARGLDCNPSPQQNMFKPFIMASDDLEYACHECKTTKKKNKPADVKLNCYEPFFYCKYKQTAGYKQSFYCYKCVERPFFLECQNQSTNKQVSERASN